MPVATSFVSPPLGFSIPYLTPHAVSVSLPTWRDNVGYEEGEQRVVGAMQTGYPRFFVHKAIQKLAGIAEQSLAINPLVDRCFLYPTLKTACSCLAFLEARTEPALKQDAYYRRLTITNPTDASDTISVYAVFTHADDKPLGKQFWQHAGDGISSRTAEHCLRLLGESVPGSDDSSHSLTAATNGPAQSPAASSGDLPRPANNRGFSRNKHYSKKSSAALEAICGSMTPAVPEASTSTGSPKTNGHTLSNGESAAIPGEDTSTYIEERYARNLTQAQAPLAKIALRRRIAGVLNESAGVHPTPPNSSFEDNQLSRASQALEKASAADATLQPSSRGVSGLTEEDVYLYPTGMSAIFHSFATVLATEERKAKSKGKAPAKEMGKSVCFGFPYTDTLKILQKWGPGCDFLGKGLDSDLENLEIMLRERKERYARNPESDDPNDKPILSLFTEFPSNPLLRSANLEKLRNLADEFGFYIVVDETIGGFVNVECLPFTDIVVSSLTKIFSGDSNVMGGSLTLNPASPHYAQLKQTFDEIYEDTYFGADAIFMERNSRDFRSRVNKINQNTEALCDFLCEYTFASGKSISAAKPPTLTAVYYPKYITPHNYEARMRHSSQGRVNGHECSEDDEGDVKPGYGSLFSLTFTSIPASKAFFDALQCCKGPSLGTNFTLACPYTLLAHFTELDWAKEWEVEEGLVRVSMGLEELNTLRDWFTVALRAAEEAA